MNEKAIAAALEPLIVDLVALEKRFDSMLLEGGPMGPQGAPGKDADPAQVALALAGDVTFAHRVKGGDGEDGRDGAGIDSPQWKAGDIHREGAHVVANLGQHFVALKDTASAPGASDDWRRIGKGGFRYCGAFDKDASYVDGDLYTKDFSTFCVIDGAPVLFASRGALGKHGATGAQGPKGIDGRDGATIIAAQATGFKLVLVQQHGDGELDHLEADFTDAYRELVRDALADVYAAIEDLKKSLREATA